jgi:hypothetical protein
MWFWVLLHFSVVWSQSHPFDHPIAQDEVTSHQFTLYSTDTRIREDFNHVTSVLSDQLFDAQDIDRFIFLIESTNCPNKFSAIPFDSCLVHTPSLERDRSCLVQPPHPPPRKEIVFRGNLIEVEIYDFFVNAIGFSLQSANISVSHYVVAPSSRCDRISYSELTLDTFLSKYWLLQKPLVIEKFFEPKERIDLEQILRIHKKIRVGAKLSFGNEFEGIDEVVNWEMSQIQSIPPDILRKLESPHLAVVRPVHKELSLAEFLNGISAKFDDLSKENPKRKSTSLNDFQFPNLYIEYLPLNDPEILKMAKQFLDLGDDSRDLLSILSERFPLLQYLLNGNAYLWMGDGRAVGKLHFDPFDNILLQVRSLLTRVPH